MTDEQLAHFRAKLEAELEDVDRRIGDARVDALEPSIEEPTDGADDAVRDTLQDTSLALGEIRTNERDEINDALLRIERGEYGVCEDCGEAIPPARLEVLPTARFCVRDASRREADQAPTL